MKKVLFKNLSEYAKTQIENEGCDTSPDCEYLVRGGEVGIPCECCQSDCDLCEGREENFMFICTLADPAKALGRLGGRAKSKAKTRAARENGKKRRKA